MIGIDIPIQKAELRSKAVPKFGWMYLLDTRYCGCQINMTQDRDMNIFLYAHRIAV